MNLTMKVKFIRWVVKSSIVISVMNPEFPSLPSADDKSSFEDLMKIDDNRQLHWQSDWCAGSDGVSKGASPSGKRVD